MTGVIIINFLSVSRRARESGEALSSTEVAKFSRSSFSSPQRLHKRQHLRGHHSGQKLEPDQGVADNLKGPFYLKSKLQCQVIFSDRRQSVQFQLLT